MKTAISALVLLFLLGGCTREVEVPTVVGFAAGNFKQTTTVEWSLYEVTDKKARKLATTDMQRSIGESAVETYEVGTVILGPAEVSKPHKDGVEFHVIGAERSGGGGRVTFDKPCNYSQYPGT